MSDSGYDVLHYRTFVLRLWQERPASLGRPAVWRFSLEDIRSRQRRGFASLEGLMAFLRAQMGAEETGRKSDKETR